MKSFWGLIPRNLWKNKKRVFSMAVAIVLSVFLIMVLFIMRNYYVDFMTRRQKDTMGDDCDIMSNTEGYNNIDKLRQDENVRELTVFTHAFAKSPVDNSSYYFELNGYEDNAMDFFNLEFIQGRQPENDDEIAFEGWILQYLDKEYKVGDKITLSCNLAFADEGTKPSEYEFTITGIFDYKSEFHEGSKGAMTWVTRSFAEKELKANHLEPVNYHTYIFLKDNYPLDSKLTAFNNDINYGNMYFLRSQFKKSNLIFRRLSMGVITILFVIIGIVVTINIYNIFSVSIKERRKEFGILKALGCSPGKIIIMVMSESFIIGIFSIMAGIVSGDFITKGILNLFNSLNLDTVNRFPAGGITASIFIGVFAVFIGTYFPASKGSKVSPVEAINDVENIDAKVSDFVIDDVTIFHRKPGFPGIMALINLKRNKKKFKTSVVSISITVILIMTSSYLIGQINPSEKFRRDYGEGDFKIQSNGANYIMDEDLSNISNLSEIEIISKEKNMMVSVYPEKDQLTEEGFKYLKGETRKSESDKNRFDRGNYELKGSIFAYDEDKIKELKDYIVDGDLDIKEGDTPTIFIVQGLNNNKYTDIKVGDEIKTTYVFYKDDGEKGGERTQIFKVGGVLKRNVLNDYDATISVGGIVSTEEAKQYLNLNGYSTVRIGIKNGSSYDQAKTAMDNTFGDMRKLMISDFREDFNEYKAKTGRLSFLLYGFVFVVAVISMINLINIMRMNVITRRKEVGMLRATGFGVDEVKKMITLEGSAYGIVAGLAGTVLGTVITYIIHKLVWILTWNFPVIEILLLMLFTICITTMASLISSRELFKTTIVDSIRSIE